MITFYAHSSRSPLHVKLSDFPQLFGTLQHSAWSESRPKNAVFGIFDQKLRKATYKMRQTFYGLLFTSHMSTNPESFVRIHRRVFAAGSSKVAKISKICFGSPKNLGDGGLNLPHHRVGLPPRYFVFVARPYISLPRFFVNFFKSQKFDHFLRGHSSAPGSKIEKNEKRGPSFSS